MQNKLKGGQREPKSLPGFSLLWKKAQNQALKKRISLKINNNIPHFKPSRTSKLWNPVFLSRLTSRHHEKEKINKDKNNKKNINVFFVLKKTSKFKIILNVNKETKRGQGLKETKWNLWNLILKII